MKITQDFKVGYRYDIHFTSGLFAGGNSLLFDILGPGRPKVLVIVDSGVLEQLPCLDKHIAELFKANAGKAELAAPPVVVRGGERCKNDMSQFMKIAGHIREAGLDRHSFIVIVGGGALQDAAGFAASLSHRGIRYIRVPTTVLSQDDSGVGVKNGINYFGIKNYFGVFDPPYAVINDFGFLRVLDSRNRRSGIAEAFKVAAIKDKRFFMYLVRNAARLNSGDEDVLKETVKRCAALHARHIAKGGDPFEKGDAKPLDFGHWSAHWLETKTGYALNHGEAVAAGMALDMAVARIKNFINKKEFALTLKGLSDAGFELWHALFDKTKKGRPAVYDGLEEFRQHLGGPLALVMPDGIGGSRIIKFLSVTELKRGLKELKDAVR